jgi:hypothetical protein
MIFVRIAIATALALLPAALAAQPAGPASTAPTDLVLHNQIDIVAPKAATVPFGGAGQWLVRIDQAGGFGCFMAAQYDNDLGIRFQFNPADNSNVIYVGSSNWGSLRAGERKAMSLSFDGHNTWSGSAQGIDLMGLHWLMLKGSGRAIFDEMKEARWFALKIDGLELGAYDAGEIGRAVEALKQCQAIADKAVDPAAAPPAAAKPLN